MAHAGNYFEVITHEKYRKLRSAKGLHAIMQAKKAWVEQAIKIILKVDTTSTQEALIQAIEKLTQKKDTRDIQIIHTGIGNVTESDITFAIETGSTIYGLHVKVDPNAASSARESIVRINLFDIIYKLLENLEERAKQPTEVQYVTKKIGEAVIRRVFRIKGVGVVAGSYLKDGRFTREGSVVAWRGNEKMGEGVIKSLERDRKPVKEVHTGFEFAFLIEGFDDWQVDDRAECFIMIPA